MADLEGSYDDLFTAVPNALAAYLDAGDVGGSAAVFVDGEPVVDVWGASPTPTAACRGSATPSPTSGRSPRR